MNFVDLEKQILEFWKNNDIFQKSVEQRPKDRKFIFFEGPPTANGKPGIHHVLARTFKDIICRYKTMRGFRVERKAGWDTHGLPVEIEVQKKLGLSSKKDIENYGIAEFNKKCKESVWEYTSDWKKMTERIAFWVDLEHPYITYENNYIETVWWIIKKIAEKKLLYKDYKVVPYCPKCETVLSTHEVAQGYQNVTEESVYIKFPVKGKENTYFLVWTTTPWTLPGNVALAVNKKLDYVEASFGTNEKYIFSEGRKDYIKQLFKIENIEILNKYSGKELLGIEYEPILEFIKPDKKAYFVIAGNFVSDCDGTGFVHIAPAFGVDDMEVGKENNLPVLMTVDLQGNIMPAVTPWAGMFVKTADPLIIEELKKRNVLFGTEAYAHDYPFCWRCKSPLLYYAKEAWFINMQEVKDKLIKNNEKINWVPAHLKEGRFGEWLKDVKDWALSRERFWATPLPVWICENKECKHIEVVGSVEELKEKSKKEAPEDLHRPYVDEIIFECPKCKSIMKRTPEVMDCWFDSGSMPFAQWHYPFENKELIDKKEQFPAEYISEAIDQTRGWFYTLLAISTLLGLESSYKNVISLGHILDEKGEKMSKSKGNIVDPWYIVEKYGVDATRWYFFTVNQPWDQKLFTEKDVDSSLKRFIMILWNCFVFFDTYKDNFDASYFDSKKEPEFKSKNVLDKWIASRLNNVMQEVEKDLNAYDVNSAARTLENFVVNDFSQWYIRRSRKRLQKPDAEEEKQEVFSAFSFVLYNLTKVLAPFVPFISEEIFRKLTGLESVHLAEWPGFGKKYIDEKLEEKMKSVQELVTVALAARSKAGIKVRQPLKELKIKDEKLSGEKELLDLIKEEINVKEISFDEKMENAVELDTTITEQLKVEGLVRETLRNYKDLRKQAGFTTAEVIGARATTATIADLIDTDHLKEIGAKEIKISSLEEMSGGGYITKEIEIDGKKESIGIKKI